MFLQDVAPSTRGAAASNSNNAVQAKEKVAAVPVQWPPASSSAVNTMAVNIAAVSTDDSQGESVSEVPLSPLLTSASNGNGKAALEISDSNALSNIKFSPGLSPIAIDSNSNGLAPLPGDLIAARALAEASPRNTAILDKNAPSSSDKVFNRPLSSSAAAPPGKPVSSIAIPDPRLNGHGSHILSHPLLAARRPELHQQPAYYSSFNGITRNALFPSPVSSFTVTVWAAIMHGAGSDLTIDPFGRLLLPVTEYLDLTMPPVDAASITPWPRPPLYYRKGVDASGHSHLSAHDKQRYLASIAAITASAADSNNSNSSGSFIHNTNGVTNNITAVPVQR